MKQLFCILFCIIYISAISQTPQHAPLPEKFENLHRGLILNHFPSPVYASSDPSQQEYQYFWKHTTSVLSTDSDIEIIECGAYIFYNQQWNLRVTYSPKDFADLFDCPNAVIKQGQPYTFKDNWRTDNRLAGGWAMWYVIGKNKEGNKVLGYEKLETVGALAPNTNPKIIYQIDQQLSSLKWKGKAAFSSYSLFGTLAAKSSILTVENQQVTQVTMLIDMPQLRCENGMVTGHLKGGDFFDVKQYPEASLTLVNAFDLNKRKQNIKAAITIKGVTKQLTIPIKIQETDKGLKITGTVAIDRTTFGITYNSPNYYPDVKDQAIANEFELMFELVYGVEGGDVE